MNNQPEWKVTGQVGDVNPVEYSGGFIFEDTTSIYPPEMEWFEAVQEGEPGFKVLMEYRDYYDENDPENERRPEAPVAGRMYRCMLDQLYLHEGHLICQDPARIDLPYPLTSYREWFDEDVESIAATCGISKEDLQERFCSTNPHKRAWAYRELAEQLGWANLDGYPVELNIVEAEERYGKYKQELEASEYEAVCE